jgi:hypothetical protein
MTQLIISRTAFTILQRSTVIALVAAVSCLGLSNQAFPQEALYDGRPGLAGPEDYAA